MKLIKSNKGLTLLELIVSFALLGIVSAAVVGLVSTGAGTYRSVNTEVSLQYESQLTMNQFEEYLVDCNGGICWDSTNKTLYAADTDESGTITVYRFQQTGDQLYYSSGTVTGSTCTFGDNYLMCSYVDSFGAALSTAKKGSRNLCTACTVTLTLQLGSRSYTARQNITMRNPALTASGLDAMTAAVAAD